MATHPDDGLVPEGFQEEVDLLKLGAYAAHGNRRLARATVDDFQDVVDRAIAQVIVLRGEPDPADPTP